MLKLIELDISPECNDTFQCNLKVIGTLDEVWEMIESKVKKKEQKNEKTNKIR